jgi:hypothetical protein
MATRPLYRRDEAKLVVPADSAMVTMMSYSSGDSDTQRHAGGSKGALPPSKFAQR